MVPTIFKFPVECCKPAIERKIEKNKQIMPAKQWENSSAISQVNLGFYLDAKFSL